MNSQNELRKTYIPFTEWEEKSKQIEYTEETPLLGNDGTLLAKGWARRNLFTYDRTKSTPNKRKKEWDFYQLSKAQNLTIKLGEKA